MENEIRSRFGKRYEIRESIGQGGMGRVYAAWDTVRGQQVAIKTLSQRYKASRTLRLKFANEYRSMLRFQHPNCVQVYEFGFSADKLPFIVMEYVEGETLSALENPTVQQAADILAQICQALAHIHSRLYVHRDLKPDNIKLLPDGTVKLIDYGLMSQLGVRSSRTISGTLHYLAPEALTGGVIDASTDLYSLGIIAYEVLTGKRPFIGKRDTILQAHLTHVAPPPSTLRADLPPSLDRVIAKLLAKRKNQRYRQAAEVLGDLEHLVSRPVTESTAQQQGYLFSSDLVGREREVELFHEQLAALHAGESGAVFFGAPAGIGKTRLLSELKALGEVSGVATVWVDDQNSADRVYGWLDELLRQVVPLSSEEELALHGPKLAPVARCLRQPGESFTADSPIDHAGCEQAVVSWFESLTARMPLILLVDNAQWMDLKSLALLNALIRAGSKQRLLVVAAYRSNDIEKTSPLFHTLDEDLSRFHEVAPLTREQSNRLLDNLLRPTTPSAEFRARVFELSGGNVFELIELLRFLIAEEHLRHAADGWLEPVSMKMRVPEDVEKRLQTRYSRLTADERALAEAASVIDGRLDLDTWQQLSGFPEVRFIDALPGLVSAQILVKEDDQFRFAHSRLKDAMAAALGDERKRSLNGQLAQLMARRLEKEPLLVRSVAHHFVLAEERLPAIEHSLAAARQTEAAGAEWYAFEHYRDAARLLGQSPDYPDQQALLHEIHSRVAQFASAAWTDATTCLDWTQAAIDHHTAAGESDAVFGLSLAYIVNSAISGNYDAARHKAQSMLEEPGLEPQSLPWAVLHGAGLCLIDWYQGYQLDCQRHAQQAIEVFEAHEAELDETTWPAYSWATFWRQKARAYLGLPLDMSEIDLNQNRIAAGRCDETIFWHTLTAVGARAAYTGRWQDLQLWQERASRLSRKMGKIYWFECWISHSYLYGAIHHGALEQLDERIAQVEASYDPYQVRLASLFAGALALERGNAALAKQKLELFMRQEEASPDNSLLEGYFYLAGAHLALGELEQAQRLADTGLELASSGPRENPHYRLQFLRQQAKLLLAAEPSLFDQAEAKLRESLELAEAARNPLQAAYAHDVLGQLYDAQGDRQRTAGQWGIAQSLFELLGNSYRASQLSEKLDALCLTARERQPQSSSQVLGASLPTEFDEMEAQTVAEAELSESVRQPSATDAMPETHPASAPSKPEQE